MQLRYRFTYDSGVERQFDVTLDPTTLALVRPARADAPPAWTALENERCPNCPLAAAASPQCPVALALDPVIAAFHDEISHHEALVTIETPARTYSKRVPVQAGISALIGVLMTTAGCPVMDKMRPMVRTHLPFATLEETMVRAMSTYLLAQHVIARRGGVPRWDLAGLADIYAEIRQVNKAFLRRLRTLRIEDASLNAIVGLDCFAMFTTMTLKADAVDDVVGLFGAYLPPEATP